MRHHVGSGRADRIVGQTQIDGLGGVGRGDGRKGDPTDQRVRVRTGGTAEQSDRGDVSGIPGVVIEVKNTKKVDLAGWQDETLAEQANAHASVAFCVFPRRSHHIGKAYVTMTFDQVIALIGDGAENDYRDGRKAE